MVALKFVWGDEIRRLNIESETNPTFSQFIQRLQELFKRTLQPGQAFRLTYVDDENDVILVATDHDLNEAFSFARLQSKPTRFTVSVNNNTSTTSTSTSTTSNSNSNSNSNFTSTSIPQSTFNENMDFLNPIGSLLSYTSPYAYIPVQRPPQEENRPHPPPQSQPQPQFQSKKSPKIRVHHRGVTCDGCNQPLFGIRFKCTECYDFDLCEDCEATENHPPQHVLLKIRVPTHIDCDATWRHPQPRFCPYRGQFQGHCRNQTRNTQSQSPQPENVQESNCSMETQETFQPSQSSVETQTQSQSQTFESQTQSQPPQYETHNESSQSQPDNETQTSTQTNASEDDQYAEPLQTLHEMGFYDSETSLKLFKEGWTIEAIISKLLEMRF